LALVNQGISCGSLDGLIGPQTHAALAAFQKKVRLVPTSELDPPTREKLLLNGPPCTAYAVTSNDLSRLQPLAPTWLGKSQQTALDYETILELIAEKSFAHPNLIRRLNPDINWTNVPAGTSLQIPSAAYPDPPAKAAFLSIHLNGRTLEVFDADTNLLAHFPCSIAQLVEKRPVGELRVATIIPNPNYTFDPDVFPESAEAQSLKHKLVLPAGPNNPVGVAWIGLDRPGYGIHGTPRPEDVGRTESHGCFRLANWNAQYLLRLVAVGTPVYVVE
jgi:lipoprotein-anchoring transpeptidase ErfK/SrfK